jgi:hypothetical protein
VKKLANRAPLLHRPGNKNFDPLYSLLRAPAALQFLHHQVALTGLSRYSIALAAINRVDPNRVLAILDQMTAPSMPAAAE